MSGKGRKNKLGCVREILSSLRLTFIIEESVEKVQRLIGTYYS